MRVAVPAQWQHRFDPPLLLALLLGEPQEEGEGEVTVAERKPQREVSATAIRFPPELHDRIRDAARERGHSINFMTVLAVEQLLDRLIPADEVKLTRD